MGIGVGEIEGGIDGCIGKRVGNADVDGCLLGKVDGRELGLD